MGLLRLDRKLSSFAPQQELFARAFRRESGVARETTHCLSSNNFAFLIKKIVITQAKIELSTELRTVADKTDETIAVVLLDHTTDFFVHLYLPVSSRKCLNIAIVVC